MTEELHELRLIAASLQFVKSAASCSSSNFIRANAPQYPAAIGWIKTANKAKWKHDPDGRPGIWVSLFWFQQGFRPPHDAGRWEDYLVFPTIPRTQLQSDAMSITANPG